MARLRAIAFALALALCLVGPVTTAPAAEPSPTPPTTGAAAAKGPGQKRDGLGFLRYDAPTAPESPGLGSLLGGLVAPLCGVIGLIYLAAWFLKRKLGLKGMVRGKGDLSEVVEVTPLGRQRYMYLVRVVDRVLVLGVTQDTISALAEIPEDEMTRSIQSGAARDFSQILAGAEVPGVLANAKPAPGSRGKDKTWQA